VNVGPVGARRLVVVDKPLNPKTLSIRPLNPVIGAEIEGVDLSRPLADEQFAEVRAALNAHHVLIFRDQTLNREDHKRFGRMFGRLHVHPYHAKKVAPEHAANRGGVGDDPEILVVRADQNSKFVAGEGWHTDVTCDAEPPMGSMLYVTETPPNGAGDTCFASTIRAYDALSTTMQGFIEGLTATHDGRPRPAAGRARPTRW
jgi:taurine dioxygenase